jgi:hypothetical protein
VLTANDTDHRPPPETGTGCESSVQRTLCNGTETLGGGSCASRLFGSDLLSALLTEFGILFVQFSARRALNHDDLFGPSSKIHIGLFQCIFDHSARHAAIRLKILPRLVGIQDYAGTC